jgi:hypothetical protein
MVRALLLLPTVLSGLWVDVPDEGARQDVAGSAPDVAASVDPAAPSAPGAPVGAPGSSVLAPVDGTVDGALCPAPQPGFLSVATLPWTIVVVDGERVGSTPLFRLPLTPGVHRIEFSNERYGVAAAEEVMIGEAELRKLKLVFLTAEGGEAALDEARAEDARDDEDCVATDGDFAFLSVDVKPWARVFVDGRSVGSTPLFRQRIRAGGHRVRLEGPRGERTIARFDAAVDELVKLTLAFDPAGPVTAATVPPPAPETPDTALPALAADELR